MSSRQHVAVIGTGIAGLTAAWVLNRRYRLTVFEQADWIGGHSNTVDVDLPEGRLPVDTGFIVFNYRTYPLLTKLFGSLDVPVHGSYMSFGVSIDGGRVEYSGGELFKLFVQKRNLLRPAFHRMWLDILRFNAQATTLLDDPHEGDPSLGDYLDRHGYSESFQRWYLLPMGAAIWSMSIAGMRDFPARSFIRFFHNHGLLTVMSQPRWYTVTGGSRDYVKRLSAPFRSSIHTKRGVRAVRRLPSGLVEVIDEHGRSESFDHVVMACHGDTAARLISDLEPRERAIIGSFGFQPNRAVLHTDTSLMPKRRAVWSSWNYLHSTRGDRSCNVSVSYWMNKLQNLPTKTDVIVTLNPMRAPDPAKVIAAFDYDHPVMDRAAMAAQRRLAEIQGRNGITFAGAYLANGFHEDGCRAGIEAARVLGVLPPWEIAGDLPQIFKPRPAVASGVIGMPEGAVAEPSR
ncbi:MAG: NAD(P)/FAD-dependent oxidoreductase [Geminicoccaceae bacterium]